MNVKGSFDLVAERARDVNTYDATFAAANRKFLYDTFRDIMVMLIQSFI
jgi:hypothetical protein